MPNRRGRSCSKGSTPGARVVGMTGETGQRRACDSTPASAAPAVTRVGPRRLRSGRPAPAATSSRHAPEDPMTQRLEFEKIAPDALQAMLALETWVRRSGIDHTLLH